MFATPDWKQRYRTPWVAYSAVAHHAPGRGVVLSNRPGLVQAHAWDLSDHSLRQLTELDAGLRFAALDPLGEWVYCLLDEGGNEVGHLAAFPWAGGDAIDLTPDAEPYAVAGVGSSLDRSLLGLTTATRAGFETLAVRRGEAVPAPVFRSTSFTIGPSCSADGAVLVVATTDGDSSLDSDLVALDSSTGEVVERWSAPDARLGAVAFAPRRGDARLLASSDASGFQRPVVWDVATGDRVELEVELDGELTPLAWHPAGDRALVSRIVDATTQLHVWHLDHGELRAVDHEQMHVSSAYFDPVGRLVAEVSDSTRPPRIVELDPDTGSVAEVLLQGGDAPAGRRWRSVRFPSTDDATIQAWVTEPEGEGPFPTIIEAHGGPTAAAFDEWSPSAQAWIDHGFAYMSVNYRGSTTFGHEFEASIRGDLGRREVDDLVAARRWLVDEGIAAPEQVVVTGWSYGGYLTLMSLGVEPDLWACGIAGIAVADWNLMYEDMNETLRQYGVALFGGTPDEMPEAYVRSSPIAYADRVRAPVLVIQGRNDTRCPARQLQAYEDRMRELGRPIRVEWFDAGHGGIDHDQRIAFHELMLDFVDAALTAVAAG